MCVLCHFSSIFLSRLALENNHKDRWTGWYLETQACDASWVSYLLSETAVCHILQNIWGHTHIHTAIQVWNSVRAWKLLWKVTWRRYWLAVVSIRCICWLKNTKCSCCLLLTVFVVIGITRQESVIGGAFIFSNDLIVCLLVSLESICGCLIIPLLCIHMYAT